MHDDLDLKAGRGLSEWAVGAVGTGAIIATSIAHDGAGGALVTGGFSGEASFGSTSFQSGDDTFDVFVMHVTASGAIDWAVRAGGASSDISYGIAHDGAGGALVTGSFNGKATFGSTSFEASGDYDVFGMLSSDLFVMHVTASGVIDWAVQAGGTDDDEGSGIACDGAGGALVTGYFSGTASFGNTSLASSSLLSSGHDPFVIHVSASGAIDWAVQAGGTRDARGTAIAYDGAGGALVSGLFSGKASFGSTSFESRGQYDVFVMHVTALGAIDWAVRAGGTSFDQSDGIAHDGAGGALVTGSFRAVASFGSTSLSCSSTENAFVMHVNVSSQTMSQGVFSGAQWFGSTLLESDNGYDTFVMHVTAMGAIDWAIQGEGDTSSDNTAYSIAHDGARGALVTGAFRGKVPFGPAVHTSDNGAYVMHVTASGVIDWVVQASTPATIAGGTTVIAGRGIANDGAGGALVTGYFEAGTFGSTSLDSRGNLDVFVMHVTASGAIDWAVQAGGTSSDEGTGIACDGAGGAFVTGAFSGKALFGSASLVSRGYQDVFVMHVTASGVIDWAVQAGGRTDEQGTGIAYDG
ncbi:pkd domain-containing protein [Chrysochromulina tobinii]|uniref:Pkd domain-containing protein n=1 Tax=Chrysochromulina tobinii TaxID=1460289 RepID=A0A0M0JH71_9EUKA|nr:pkd domain-containing protein [Chrysochromulina tobinii]|eukprot:KOO25929.1 pkd domain-containing protein [Chrysochromulina sp. CCMP291]